MKFYLFATLLALCLFTQQTQSYSQKYFLYANHLPKQLLEFLSLDSKCNGNGYMYNGLCYCLDTFGGTLCEKADYNGFYNNTNDNCDDLVNRLDHLLNMDPQIKYVDDSIFSRILGDSIGKGKAAYGAKGTVWVPMHGASREPFNIFNKTGNIYSRDVAQGALGNCYLLAGIASLVTIRDGEIIKDMFQTQQDNPNHIYILRWFIDGRPVYVSTDDYVPGNRDGSTSFSTHKHGLFWASIIEKQWAKIYGNYMNTEAGQSIIVWRAITGAPVRQLPHDQIDDDSLFDKLVTFFQNEWAVGAATPQQDQTKLVGGHAYSVIGAYTVTSNGQQVKLVKCYNPHAQENAYPENPWKIGSSLWTQDIIDQVGYINDNNGQFFLSINDYRSQFILTYWAEVTKGYGVVYQQIPLVEQPAGQSYVQYSATFTNSGTEGFTVSIQEVEERLIRGCQEPFTLGYGFQVNSPSGVKYQSNWEAYGVMSAQVPTGEVGTYTIDAYIQSANTFHKFFTIDIYSKQGNVVFQERADKYVEPQPVSCPDQCSQHGVCNTYNGQCFCDFAYSGNNCAVFTQPQCPNNCGGAEAGVCQLDGQCKCNPGYRLDDSLSCQKCVDIINWCEYFAQENRCITYSYQASRDCPAYCQVGTCFTGTASTATTTTSSKVNFKKNFLAQIMKNHH